MATVKVHHPFLKSCTYVVELDDVMAAPRPCPSCSRPGEPYLHQKKSIHLRLDSNGDVLITPEVWQTLAKRQGAGLELDNPVGTKPPPTQIGFVDRPTAEIIKLGLGDKDPYPLFYVPGKSKWDTNYQVFQRLIQEAEATLQALKEG